MLFFLRLQIDGLLLTKRLVMKQLLLYFPKVSYSRCTGLYEEKLKNTNYYIKFGATYALGIHDTIIHCEIKRICQRLRNHCTGPIIKNKTQTRARLVRVMFFSITRMGLAHVKNHKLRGRPRPRNFF